MIKTFLPNYTKKIAFALYLVAVVFSCIANVDSFLSGYHDASTKAEYNPKNITYDRIPNNLEKRYTWISLAFSFTGLLMYIFSKEKVEDEYMQLLRIKALTWSIVLTWLAVIFTMTFISPLEGLYVLQFQLVAFLGSFACLKRFE
ncbi:MAG: hypothetical protein JXA53_05315 [Bacteroidales bacterium]|nr:hypothetical protein [Bacteroidales bacterium]